MQDTLNSIVLYNFQSFTQMVSDNLITTLSHPLHPYTAHPPFPLPTGNHQFVSVRLLLFCFIHQFVVFFRFHIQVISYSICLYLTYFTQHSVLQVHPHCCKWQNFYSFFMAFRKILWKNPNELFGQPYILHLSIYLSIYLYIYHILFIHSSVDCFLILLGLC